MTAAAGVLTAAPKKMPLTTALLLLGPGGARFVTRMITLPLMLKLTYSPRKLVSVSVASTVFVAGSITSIRSSRTLDAGPHHRVPVEGIERHLVRLLRR